MRVQGWSMIKLMPFGGQKSNTGGDDMATYNVLLTACGENCYTARTLALPDIVATGTSEAEALDKLRAASSDLLARSRMVKIEVDQELPGTAQDDPWLRFAGMWKDDPSWDEFQEEVAKYRAEIDAKFVPN